MATRAYLSRHHARIVEALREAPRSSSAELAATLRLSPATIRQAMTDLRKFGFRIRCERTFWLVKDPDADL